MSMEELEKWNEDFDAGLIDVSTMVQVPIQNYGVTCIERIDPDFSVNEILALNTTELLSFSHGYNRIILNRVRSRSLECLFDRAEKSKGRYSTGVFTDEEKDFNLKLRLERGYKQCKPHLYLKNASSSG